MVDLGDENQSHFNEINDQNLHWNRGLNCANTISAFQKYKASSAVCSYWDATALQIKHCDRF